MISKATSRNPTFPWWVGSGLLGLVLLSQLILGCSEAPPPPEDPKSAVSYLDGKSLDITLPRAAGGHFRPLSFEGKPTRVVLFLATDCPIANGYAPEINRIAAAYRDRVGPFVMVHVDPEVDRDRAHQHALDYGFEGEVILDQSQVLARALGATVTPEVVVLRRRQDRWQISYRGRIDDLYVNFGQKRVKASQADLRLQLDRALTAEGRILPLEAQKAIGCPMPKAGS